MTADIRYMGHGLIADATQEGQGRVVGTFRIRAVPTPAETQQEALRALAERTRGQLLDLVREPSVERCDLMVRALAEVATAVRRLSAELAQTR